MDYPELRSPGSRPAPRVRMDRQHQIWRRVREKQSVDPRCRQVQGLGQQRSVGDGVPHLDHGLCPRRLVAASLSEVQTVCDRLSVDHEDYLGAFGKRVDHPQRYLVIRRVGTQTAAEERDRGQRKECAQCECPRDFPLQDTRCLQSARRKCEFSSVYVLTVAPVLPGSAIHRSGGRYQPAAQLQCVFHGHACPNTIGGRLHGGTGVRGRSDHRDRTPDR